MINYNYSTQVPDTKRRSRTHIDSILGLDDASLNNMQKLEPISTSVLKKLKSIYDTSVKPLEDTYNYNDITNRHMSEAEIFSRPMVLLLGPYSTGKSTFLNFLMNIEKTKRALPTRKLVGTIQSVYHYESNMS